MIAALYSPAARGKLPSPSGGGLNQNLGVHPSTEPGHLQRMRGQGMERRDCGSSVDGVTVGLQGLTQRDSGFFPAAEHFTNELSQIQLCRNLPPW